MCRLSEFWKQNIMVDTIDQIVVHNTVIKSWLPIVVHFWKKMKEIFRKIAISLVAIAANNEKGTPKTFARPTLPLPTANLGCERDLLLILVHFPRFKAIFRRAVGPLLLGISQRRFYIMKAWS